MALTSFSSCSYCWIYVELIILSLWHWSSQILVKFVFHAIPKLDWSNFPKFYLLQGRYLLWRLIILATSNQGCNMLKPSVCPHPSQHLLSAQFQWYSICNMHNAPTLTIVILYYDNQHSRHIILTQLQPAYLPTMHCSYHFPNHDDQYSWWYSWW